MKIRMLVRWGGAVLIVAAVAVVAVTYGYWAPDARAWLADIGWLSAEQGSDPAHDLGEHAGDEHRGHDHEAKAAHPGHDEATAIALSRSGLKNIGFVPLRVELGTFQRTLTLPAMVVERPGHSQIHITAPLAGIVTSIQPMEGAAVEPHSPLFTIRLTHEELVAAQRDFLRTAESLDVINREIARLEGVDQGVIAGKRILEQEYEKQKLEASLLAERQALLLHGLSDTQIDQILASRQLVQSLTVEAPVHTDADEGCEDDHLFHMQELLVKPGQHVDAGQLLCILADHCQLFIEGRAFEEDAAQLREAARKGWEVTATTAGGDAKITGLRLLYLADRVDPDSRAFRFYVRLPNEVALDQVLADGHRFIAWKFNPGQRMELQVPVERWENRLVLPAQAIVEEGAESYVFERNGDHFDRVPVHVEYRDQESVVVANDGMLQPGDIIAARGAYQLYLQMKRQSGAGVDPHAGHKH